METRAHHLLIGSFMLLMIIGLFAFFIWLAKVDIDTEFTTYDIYFEGSVAGLSEGGAVQLNGVPLGTVRDISIPKARPNEVLVRVRLESDVPVLEDSKATLQAQGFTGVAFVEISGGMAGSAPLVPTKGQEYAVIPSEPSALQRIFQDAPNLVNEAIIAVGSLRELLNEDNRAQVSLILKNVQVLSSGLANRSDDIERLLGNLDDTIADFRQTAQAFTALATRAEEIANDDLRQTLADARLAMQSANQLLQTLDGTVEDNRGAVRNFTNATLPEVTRLVLDLRVLVASMTRIAEQFEDSPIEALFGEEQPEFLPSGGN